MTVSESRTKVLEIINDTDWDERTESPELTVTLVEAKAKLIEAVKKLDRVLNNSCTV